MGQGCEPTEEGAVDCLQLVGSEGAEAKLFHQCAAHCRTKGVLLAGEERVLAVVARLAQELSFGVDVCLAAATAFSRLLAVTCRLASSLR